MVMSTFTAKFPGTCQSCMARIEVGQEIMRMADSGFVHADCDASDVSASVLRSNRYCAHPACGMELPLAGAGAFCDDHS